MITIFGELYSSKNHKRIVRFGNRMALIKSKQCMEHEKELYKQLIDLKPAWESEKQLMNGNKKPLRVAFKIYRKTHRRFDYINIIQELCDLMVRAEWIDDDNADELLPIFWEYEVDKDNPRVELKII